MTRKRSALAALWTACIFAVAAMISAHALAQNKAQDKAQDGSPRAPKATSIPLSLPPGVPSAVIEIADERILFATRGFPSLQVGDLFYVLTARRDGLLAKVRIVEMGSAGQAICELVEGGRGWSLQNEGASAGGLRIVRAQDAQDHAAAFERGPLLLENPDAQTPYAAPAPGHAANAVVLAGLSASLARVDAAGLFSESRVAPRALALGIFSELFVPHWGGASRYLNWVGVRMSFVTASAEGVAWTLDDRVRQGTAESEKLTVSPGVRAWFDSRWASRVALFYDAYAKEKTTFAGASKAQGQATILLPAVKFEYEAMPLASLVAYLGASRTLGGKGTLAKSDAVSSSSQDARETLTALEGGIGSRLVFGALPHALGVDMRVGLRYAKRETILGGEPSLARSQLSATITLSTSYLP